MAIVALGAALAAPPSASAHRSPVDCNANEFDVNLLRDRFDVKNGDVINYRVTLDNLSSTATKACDVSNITVRLQFPGPDGQPSSTFQIVVAAANYSAEQPVLTFGPFPYTVNANPGVTRLEARVSVENGDLHDGATHSKVNINKTIGSDRPIPGIEIDKTATPTSGQAPQTTSYTFRVYNRTTPPRPLDNVTVTDDMCPNVVRGVPTGDINNDNRLDPDEIWLYTCTMQHGAGTFTNTATACAELFIDSGPLPRVCDTDTETVTYTPPPVTPPVTPPSTPPSTPPTTTPPSAAPPQGGVLPGAVTQCRLSRVRSTTVRAGQLNTIVVRARTEEGPVANRLVRITLPGGRVVSARTNKSGVATLRVRPPGSGRAIIRAGSCTTARVSVLQARRVASRQVPKVTG
jgi:hypothetical protein